jgi:hypothetical protein
MRDRPIGMLMPELNRSYATPAACAALATAPRVFRHAFGMRALLLSRRVLIICGSVVSVSKGGRTVGTFGAIRLAKAMSCWTAFPANSDTSVGIRTLVYFSP